MNIRIVSLDSNSSQYGQMLQRLESTIEYPYGDDFFKLDHGSDYFAFFKRLGTIKFNLALHRNEVVGCAAGILRTIKFGTAEKRCWYLCDLKVRKDFLGMRIPSMLIRKNLFKNYIVCGRAYAISMNPGNRENRVINLLKKFSWLPFKHVATLNFYTLSYDEVLNIAPVLQVHFSSNSFLSLHGKKDLIMKSSGEAMPLLHFQHGQFAELGCGPTLGSKHMFCATPNSKLDTILKEKFQPQATASIIAHRMTDTNWDFVLSSDI